MSKEPDLKFILERIAPGDAPECFQMWACRGVGRGCNRNQYRKRTVHCEDCVLAENPEETLEQLQTRLKRGDA